MKIFLRYIIALNGSTRYSTGQVWGYSAVTPLKCGKPLPCSLLAAPAALPFPNPWRNLDLSWQQMHPSTSSQIFSRNSLPWNNLVITIYPDFGGGEEEKEKRNLKKCGCTYPKKPGQKQPEDRLKNLHKLHLIKRTTLWTSGFLQCTFRSYILALHRLHVWFTEAFYIRQRTDTLLRPLEGTDFTAAVTLRPLQSKHPQVQHHKTTPG